MLKIFRNTISLTISGLIIVAIIAGCAYYAWQRYQTQQDEELQIEQTANLVTNIRKIAELSTISYYSEFTLTESRTTPAVDNTLGHAVAHIIGHKDGALLHDQLVIIAKGKVRAGYNLSQIKDSDLRLSGDTVYLHLPEPQILDATINPSGFDIFLEDGRYNHHDVQALQSKAVAKLKNDAIKSGILAKARQNGIEQLQNLYQSLGYVLVPQD